MGAKVEEQGRKSIKKLTKGSILKPRQDGLQALIRHGGKEAGRIVELCGGHANDTWSPTSSRRRTRGNEWIKMGIGRRGHSRLDSSDGRGG